MTLRAAAGEEGSIAAAAAIALVVFSMLGLALLHIGDVALHRRHLQLQTDAGAFAAAQGFSKCISDPGNAFATMTGIANQYGGFAGAASYNRQVEAGGPTGGPVNAGYNNTAYPSPSTRPADDDGGDLTSGADPCTAGIFDVKAVEPSVSLLGVLHTEVNAHSAVELRTVGSVSGLLPLAVPDPRFNYAFATFINESTGAAVAGCANGCTVQLQKGGLDASGNQIWSSPAALAVPIVKDVGLRLRLVGGTDSTAACGTQTVGCYTDPSTSTAGVVHIRGWSGGAAPQAHNVNLLSGTCTPDAYFATADCSAGIQAQLDFGGTALSKVTVTASIAGGGSVTLTPAATPISGTLYLWTSLNGLAVTGSGGHDVTLSYAITGDKTCKVSNPCALEASASQRAFEGSTDVSGPIQLAQVSDANGAGANSFQVGQTPSLSVGLVTSGSLQAKSAATSPLVTLRVAGSQSQSFDCDPAPGTNLASEIATGCAPKYTVDTDPNLACPAYNVLWNTAQPWPCVKTQTGGSVGQVDQGLADRILGGSKKCPTGTYGPIHWPYDQTTYPNDPRVVSLIITPFGAFSGTGNAVYPVIDFGTFYITGWDNDPCPGAVTSVGGGDIVGHFIKYVSPKSPTPSTTHCFFTDPNQITPCVAVLTR